MSEELLVTFVTARLDEEEKAARELAGTTWVVKRLGDYDYEIWVVHEPLIHSAPPTVGLASVHGEEAARWIADHHPRQRLREIEAMRIVVAAYQRCDEHPLHVPEPEVQVMIEQRADILESVVMGYASFWSGHPNYQQEWKIRD